MSYHKSMTGSVSSCSLDNLYSWNLPCFADCARNKKEIYTLSHNPCTSFSSCHTVRNHNCAFSISPILSSSFFLLYSTRNIFSFFIYASCLIENFCSYWEVLRSCCTLRFVLKVVLLFRLLNLLNAPEFLFLLSKVFALKSTRKIRSFQNAIICRP